MLCLSSWDAQETTLACNAVSHVIRMLFSPELLRLSVSGPLSSTYLRLFGALWDAGSTLRTLSITRLPSNQSLPPSVIERAVEWLASEAAAGLEAVELGAAFQHFVILQALGNLPNLMEASLGTWMAQVAHWDTQFGEPGPAWFPSLQSLEAGPEVVRIITSGQATPWMMRRLRVISGRAKISAALVQSIGSLCSGLVVIHLQFGEGSRFSASCCLEPLTRLRHLEEAHIHSSRGHLSDRDCMAVAKAWPALKAFILRATHTRATLLSIAAFSQECPNLSVLSLPIRLGECHEFPILHDYRRLPGLKMLSTRQWRVIARAGGSCFETAAIEVAYAVQALDPCPALHSLPWHNLEYHHPTLWKRVIAHLQPQTAALTSHPRTEKARPSLLVWMRLSALLNIDIVFFLALFCLWSYI